MPEAPAEDTEKSEQTEDVEQQEETEQKEEPEQDETSTNDSGESLLDEGAGDPTDSLPDHMVTEGGGIDSQEVYKSVDGMVDEIDDVNDIPPEAFNEDGQLDPEGLVEVRKDLRDRLASEEEEGESDEDEENPSDDDVPESPDDYEIDIEYDEDDEINQKSMEVAKKSAHEADMTQEQFEQFVKNYEEKFVDPMTEHEREQELKKISDDVKEAEKVVNQVNQQLQGLHNQGLLSESELQEAQRTARTAEQVNVYRKLFQKIKDKPVPEDNSIQSGESISDLRAKEQEIMQKEGYNDPGHPNHENLNEKARKIREKIIDKQK